MPNKSTGGTQKQLVAENKDLRARLDEAEETLRAIRSGEVDALVVPGVGGDQIFTLQGADHSYRLLIEEMNEGALTLTAEGVILYANRRFAEFLKTPLEKVIGSTIHTWIAPADQKILQSLLRQGADEKRCEELVLTASDGTQTPVYLSVNHLFVDEMPISFCLVATDLTEQKRSDGIVAAEKLAQELLAAANQSRLVLLSVIEDQKQAEETLRQRLAELDAINHVSRALRAAQTLDEMLPLLLDVTLEVMHATNGAIWLYDAVKDELRPVVSRGWGEENGVSPQQPMKPAEGITGNVFASGQSYITREYRLSPYLSDTARQRVPPGIGGATIPIRAGENVIGTLTINVPLPRELTPDEVYLLTTLSEIAGNAIQRTTLHQKIERQLDQLETLHSIDLAIATNTDLGMTLNILLEHLTSQLKVDAVSVLLLNPHSQILEYAAGRGFRTHIVQTTRIRLGQSFAGRVALNRRPVQVAQIRESSHFAALWAGEDFVDYYGVPLIVKGQVKGVLEIYQRAAFHPDPDWISFLETLAGQAALAIDNAQLFENLEHTNTELILAYDSTIEGWSHALDLRDKETEWHTRRVTEITLRLAKAMGIGDAELVHIRRGALLHDIGKMGVPDSILLKPGKLTDAEWKLMRMHPQLAYDLISPINYLRPALDIPYFHHEKWDGTGYPRGLAGEQIPLAARIFAVVDVWDALRSDRPYRLAWAEDKVLEHIRAQSGKHFDPRVVEVCLASGVLGTRAPE